MKLLKFSQPSCAPCRMVSDYLNRKGVEYEEINVLDEKNAELANKFKIQSVPVLVLVDDNGEFVDQAFKFNPAEIDRLIDLLNS
jgi:thioredoxin 1